jgi:hypothetical protein
MARSGSGRRNCAIHERISLRKPLTHMRIGIMRYLIQYELDGQWFTCARRKNFKDACAKARSEGRAMKWAHMTSIIKDGDPEILRRTAEDNFGLRRNAKEAA